MSLVTVYVYLDSLYAELFLAPGAELLELLHGRVLLDHDNTFSDRGCLSLHLLTDGCKIPLLDLGTSVGDCADAPVFVIWG